MNFTTLAAIPLLLMAQTYTLVITQKDGKTIQIQADDIATLEFEADKAPELPVLGALSLKGGEATSTSIQALLTADENMAYCVGIVPRDGYMTDAQLISYVNTNSDAQRKELTGMGREQEVIFSGLEPDSYYVLVAFDSNSTDTAIKSYVATSYNTTPGYQGQVFPFGVSSTEGFYDVDKVGNNSQYGSGWTTDIDMCWACSCAGAVAWWLDDYKSKTGEDFPLPPGVLPEKSACYSTPVFDVFLDAYNNNAGSPDGIKWFFHGIENNTSVNGGTMMLRESYKYWKGGFAGVSLTDFLNKFIQVRPEAHYSYEKFEEYQYTYQVCRNSPRDSSQEEVAKTFSTCVLEALKEGAAYVGFGGNHALSLWGADYEVLPDGTPKVTHLYIGENDVNPKNSQNALEHCAINYSYDGKIGRQGYVAKMTTPIRGEDTIVHLVFVRGWQPE